MSPIVRQYYRIPREDRVTYIQPAPGELAALVERNRRLIASYDFPLAGRPFAEFRAAARAEAVAVARAYAARWGLAAPAWTEPAPLVFTGHQPPPFHPGVWIKNFLAGALAGAVGGVGVNLIVDNDEAHPQVLRFPTRRPAPGQGGGDGVRLAEVRLTDGAAGRPFEEQPPSALRREAPAECLPLVEPASTDALRRFAGLVEGAAGQAVSAGEALSVARHRLEESLGLRNLELPVSLMADSQAFRLFLAAMLARHEGLFAACNDSLAEYRRVYRERSPAQPVPDLARDGRRVEMPYWAWRAGEARRRLWVRPQGGGGLALEADREPMGVLSAADLADAASGAARLAALAEGGWKIRPRALTLTLFVHLALGDVFVHGLGGALYDKVTDAMFERLLGIRAPQLVLASCTVHLLHGAYPSAPADLAAARRRVRDWRFNPDRVMPAEARGRPEAAALIAEKRSLLGRRAASRDQRLREYRRVHAINEVLAALGADGPAAAARDLDRVRRELRLNAILANREVPFWLHAPEALAAFYREATAALGGR